MIDFRPETFIQFFQLQKSVWFLKIIWIAAAIGLLITFFFFRSAFLGLFIFCIIILPLQVFFYYNLTYRMYTEGKRAFVELNDPSATIVYDISVFIRGFDLFNKKALFSNSQPIYDFDQADIIISRTSLILLGKKKQFGTVSYASPVEIRLAKRLTSISTASLLSWTEDHGRVIIEIKDELYNKPFKIEFKDHNDKLRLWLRPVQVFG